jgi:adenine-specific DNA-methyltransferase
LCKHLGFIYSPSQDPAEYWRHGHSTETDFIYVTTQSLTYDALKKLSEEVGPKRTLLVCCKAFNAKEDSFLNLTVKKIPHSILAKCEWGRDDYSLRIANLPQTPLPEVVAEAAGDGKEPKASKPESALPLFDNMGGE